MKRPLLVLTCIALHCGFVNTSAQEIVKDIDTSPGSMITSSSDTQRCVPCNNLIFFVAVDSLGSELWRTDGTSEGTNRIVDLLPGAGNGVPRDQNPFCLNNFLYFSDGPRAIWRTDGTSSGTTRVTNEGVRDFNDVVVVNNKIYYSPLNAELVSTSGIEGSQQVVIAFDDSPGVIPVIYDIAAGATRVYFAVTVTNNAGADRWELWRSDGTQEGTTLVKTFELEGRYESPLKTVGDRVFFYGFDDAHGKELWMSDGTESGTKMVADLSPGTASSSITMRTEYGGNLLFSKDYETWVTDGTAAGTRVLFPEIDAFSFLEFNGALYAMGTQTSSGYYGILMKTDGTPEGTDRLDTLGVLMHRSLQSLTSVDSKLILPFTGTDTGIELGISDGTFNNASLLKDISAGPSPSSPAFFAELNGQVIFLADDGVHGFEVWKTDGTTEGTTMVRDIISGTQSAWFARLYFLNGKLYFLGGADQFSNQMWVSDGTAEGTIMIHDDFAINGIGQTNTHIIGQQGSTLVKTNGTTGGASVMWDYSGLNGQLYSFSPISAGDNFYFIFTPIGGSHELWRANTVTNEVIHVQSIDDSESSPATTAWRGTDFGNEIIFSWNDPVHGDELWITENGGTQKKLLMDINPGTAHSNICCFKNSDGKVFFIADDGVHGAELWTSDGTVQGTKMVKDVGPVGSGASMNGLGTSAGGKVIFSGYDGTRQALWSSDGTETGTQMLKDINAKAFGLANFVTVGDKVFFTASIEGGSGLYETDGTSQGTRLIATLAKTHIGPLHVARSGNAVYFYTDNKVWRTAGHPETVELVADKQIQSGLYSMGNKICFVAQHSLYGNELLRVDVTKFSQTITFEPIESIALGAAAFQIQVRATSGLPVSVSTTDDNITLSGLSVLPVKPGKATITAVQEGDALFASAPVTSETFCINPVAPTISAEFGDTDVLLTSSSSENNYWYKGDELINSTDAQITVSVDGIYKLRVSVEDCFSEFSELATIFTGTEDLQRNVKVYPNPASGFLQVQVPENRHSIQLRITDLTGRIIYESISEEMQTQIDLSKFKNGLYVMHIRAGMENSYHLFVKE